MTNIVSIPQKGSDRPFGRYLKNVRSSFAERWFDIGLELLEPSDEPKLRIIRSNKLGKDECCAEMLELWIDRRPDATWKQLIEALKTPGVELHSVSSNIENMLTKNEEPSSGAAQQSSVPTPQIPLTFASDEDIKLAFIKLSKLVQQAIKHTDFVTVKQASMESAMFPTMALKSKEIRSIVQESQSFQTLVDLLTEKCYWNFLDTRMMEAMATVSGIPAAQESIKNYKNTFYEKRVKEVAPSFKLYERDESDLTLIKEVCNKDMTINELNHQRFFIETELNAGTLTVCKIVIGSLNIDWQIHNDHVYQAYSMIKKKHHLLASHSIIHLSIPEVIRWEELPILWRGQEVGQIGPLQNSTKLKSCPLPEGLEWAMLHSDNVDEIIKLYDGANSVGNKNTIQWNFKHPDHKKEFTFGVRESSSKKLVWTIWCVPYHISIKGQSLPVVELQQQGIYYGGKQNELYNAVTREAMNRVSKFGISQSVLVLPKTQIIRSTITLPYWVYDFAHPLHPLPYDSPRTAGLRRMMPEDIPSALTLVNQYVSQFEIGQIFQTEEEFLHYCFCPSISDYIVTYVIEDIVDGNITDLFGFRLHTFTDINNTIVKTATSSAVVNTKSPTRQLITDLLLCAKQEKVDLLCTQQFGLASSNFENLLEHDCQYEYWHIFNYNYPEVDENNSCVFYSSLAVGVNKLTFYTTDHEIRLSTSEDSQQVTDRKLEEHWKPKRSERPTRRHVKTIKSLFAEKWYDIGLELLEPEDENKLRLIKSSKQGKFKSCHSMLELWLDRQPDATWNQLIAALRSPGVELFDVASKIERMLIEPPTQVSHQPLQPSPPRKRTVSINKNIQRAFSRLVYKLATDINILETAQHSQQFYNLVSYSNFLDIRMLEAVANASSVPAAQESIEDFKEMIFGLTLIEAEPYFPADVYVKPGHTIMREVLDKDPSEMTVGDLHKHRYFIEKEIIGKPNTCMISWILIGSVIIEWKIHIDYVYQANIALESKLSQLALQSVTHLSIPEVIRWAELPIFWRGQEVTHIGPFEDLMGVPSYTLPEGLEWTTLSFDDIDEIMNLYDSTYKIMYQNALLWNFKHPDYKSEFVFGVRESSSKKLVWAIWCVPYHISIKGQSLPVVELQQQGMYYGGQQDELYNAVTREAMKRLKSVGILQSVISLTTPEIIRPTISFTLWVYNFLLPSHPPLPYNSPRTTGLRKMTPEDIPSALALTNQYASKFEIGQLFQTEKEFLHYFLCPSVPDYMVTYVVEDPVNGNITDLFGFRLHTFTINDAMMKSATVSVIVNIKTPTRQLITDLLLCAKQEEVDLLGTQQYGLASSNFENLLVHDYQYEYWHIYNYSYPEVDEECCCVFSYQ